jgi:hypothetical protein
MVSFRLFIIYFAFSYSYDFHCGGVKWESRRWMGIKQVAT